MPTIGGARIQAVTGIVTFTTPEPTNAPLAGFAVQSPVEGIDLFENLTQVGNNVTLFLRSIVPGPGIKLTTQNGVLYLSISEGSLPPGPSGPTGPTGASGLSITGPTGAAGPTYYDFAGYWRGALPDDNLPLHYLQVVRAFFLPTGLAGSTAACLVAPTGAVSMALKKNGVTVGSMHFASAATTGTFSFLAPVSFAPGDVWEVDPPSPQNTTFSGVAWTIVATVL